MIDLSELWRPPLYWWTYSIHFNPVYYSISMLWQWPGTVASEATCGGIFRIFQVVMLLKAKELSYQSMHLSDFDCDFDIKAGFFNSFVSPFYSMPFRSKTLPAANGVLVRGGGSTSLTVDFTVSRQGKRNRNFSSTLGLYITATRNCK